MIVDGVHTCQEAVKLAYRASPKRLVTMIMIMVMMIMIMTMTLFMMIKNLVKLVLYRVLPRLVTITIKEEEHFSSSSIVMIFVTKIIMILMVIVTILMTMMMIMVMAMTMMMTNGQVLVTDAIAGLGLKEGDFFRSGQQEAQVDNL